MIKFLTRCYLKEERSLLAHGLKDTQSVMGLRGCGCRSLWQQLVHISVDQEAMLRQEVGPDYKSQGPPTAPHCLQLVPTSERVQISENSAASGTPSIKTSAPVGTHCIHSDINAVGIKSRGQQMTVGTIR